MTSYSENFQIITVGGLYDDQTGNPLFGTLGAPLPIQGSPASASGLIVAGVDNNGNLQALSLTPNGYLNVNATISASTFNQGNQGTIAESWFVEVTDGTVVLGTSSHPFYVQGTVAATQSGPWTVQVSNFPTTLSELSFTDYGSPPVEALNVYVVNPVPVSGVVTVNQGTSPWITKDASDGTTGSAAGTTAIQVAGVDGAGNLQAFRVTTNRTTVVIPADEAEAASLSYYSYDNGGAYISTTGGAPKVLWSIESNSASVTFLLRELQWFTDGTVTRFQLVKNGTLTGATFIAVSPSPNVKVDTAATSVSGGSVVMSGYVGANPRNFDSLMDAMASGTPGDKFTIVALAFGTGSGKAAAQLRWSEQAAAL